MARQPGAKAEPSRRYFGFAELGRMTLWAFCAAFALTVTAYAATTKVGSGRVKVALVEIREIFSPSGVKRPKPLDAQEGRRLTESVRALTAERDRLLTRVAALEHQIGDVTGSVARLEQTAAAHAAASAQPQAPAATAPQADAIPSQDVTSSIGAPAANVPLPAPQPSSREYGLDLGSGANVEALRSLWAAALKRYSTLLEGLRPLVQMREPARNGSVELRLVVGPIPNAATAARLCATITAAGAVCQPASYDGQRLALK